MASLMLSAIARVFGVTPSRSDGTLLRIFRALKCRLPSMDILPILTSMTTNRTSPRSISCSGSLISTLPYPDA
ncbi:hypothetical protein D3C83_64440 [compost metagenome]